MRFYLSSYKFGSDFTEFILLLPKKDYMKLAYIPNAGDPWGDLEERNHEHLQIENMKFIFDQENLDIDIDMVDLRNYFNKERQLEAKLRNYDILWVKGGNVYVLREAMRLSGFDSLLKKWFENEVDILYAGYSAGICVLAANLEGIHLMDDMTPTLYGPLTPDTKGLGILEYLIIPHFESPGHPETELANECIDYMEKHNLAYEKLRDGEVILLNDKLEIVSNSQK